MCRHQSVGSDFSTHPLLCVCLNCLCRFRDPVGLMKATGISKPMSWQTIDLEMPALNRGSWWVVLEPRRGDFGEGGFCRIQRHTQEKEEYPRILEPAVHLALRVPQSREAHILAKTSLKKTLFGVTFGCCFAPPSCRQEVCVFLCCMTCLKLTKTN